MYTWIGVPALVFVFICLGVWLNEKTNWNLRDILKAMAAAALITPFIGACVAAVADVIASHVSESRLVLAETKPLVRTQNKGLVTVWFVTENASALVNDPQERAYLVFFTRESGGNTTLNKLPLRLGRNVEIVEEKRAGGILELYEWRFVNPATAIRWTLISGAAAFSGPKWVLRIPEGSIETSRNPRLKTK